MADAVKDHIEIVECLLNWLMYEIGRTRMLLKIPVQFKPSCSDQNSGVSTKDTVLPTPTLAFTRDYKQ